MISNSTGLGRLAISILLIAWLPLGVAAQKPYLDQSLSFRNKPVKTILDSVVKRAHLLLDYGTVDLPDVKISFQTGPGPVAKILRELFADLPMQAEVRDGRVTLQPKPLNAFSLQVLDHRGIPLAAVSVYNRLQQKTTQTATDGYWYFSDWRDAVSVTLSYVGYRGETVTIQGHRIVQLQPTNAAEEAVEKVGYGESAARSLTSSISRPRWDIPGPPPPDPGGLLRLPPGVLIRNTTDIPHASYSVEVRGSRSVEPSGPVRNIDQPLITINGIPCEACTEIMSQLASAAGDPQGTGAGLSTLGYLNTQMIASIDVLKDGLSTAIFGGRASAGVAMITLQQPVPGPVAFTFSHAEGPVNAYRIPRLQNTAAYLSMRREAFTRDGIQANRQGAPDLYWDSTRYTDWARWLYKNPGSTSNTQLTATGGNSQFSWLANVNHQRSVYVYPVEASDQWTRLYTAFTIGNRKKTIQVNTQGWLSLQQNHSPAFEVSPLIYLYPHLPALQDATGRLLWQLDTVPFTNPLGWLRNEYRARSTHVFGSLQAKWRVLPSLSAQVNLGISRQLLQEVSLFPIAVSAPRPEQYGHLSRAAKAINTWIVQPQLDWQRILWNHQLSVTLGGSIQQTRTNRGFEERWRFANDSLLYQDGASFVSPSTLTGSLYRLSSAFTRLKYEPGPFLLEAVGRTDASSRISPAHHNGYFGATGAAWVFSSTDWVRRRWPWLQFGRLHVNHGLTGSDQARDYTALSQWQSTSVAIPYGLYPGLVEQPAFKADIPWQTSVKSEGGLVVSAKGLRAEATYYYHRHRDQVVSYPSTSQGGYPSVTYRPAPIRVDNYGWEFLLGFKDDSGKVKIHITLNYTRPWNKLRSLGGLESTASGHELIPGRPLSARYLYHATGVDPSTGRFQVDDLDGSGYITDADKRVVRDLEIRGYGGLQAKVSLDTTWSFGLVLEWRVQPGYSPAYYQYLLNPPGQQHPLGLSNAPVEALQRWQPGITNLYQRYSAHPDEATNTAIQRQLQSDGFLTDQSWLCLRWISLEYRPRTKPHFNGVAELFLFLQVQNLLVLSRYPQGNPLLQNPYSQPVTRSCSAGFRVRLK